MFWKKGKDIKKTVEFLEKLAEESELYTLEATMAATNIKKLVFREESDLGKKITGIIGLLRKVFAKTLLY
jgi:uncharacterized protein Smg (DUF494 family)